MFFALTAANEPVKLIWDLRYELITRFSLTGAAQATVIILSALLCIVSAYLIGSINPAILISRLVYHDDIRTHGSGNAGTTNMLRSFGKKAAVATLLLDFSKAVVAVLIGRLLFGPMGMSIAGFFAGFGHMFPLYTKFQGGKGVACFGIVALMISPPAFLCILATFVIVLIGTRYVSLASVMAALLYPLFMNAFAGSFPLAPAMGVLAACFVVFMHRENLKRLWRNEEPKLDFSKLKIHKKSKKTTEENDDESAK